MQESRITFTSAPASRFVVAWLGMLVLVGGVLFPGFTLLILNWSTGKIDWIQRNYECKTRCLEARPSSLGPRLLIFGGSASVFGLDAELMEYKLGIQTVNFATGAGLGVDYQISRIKRHAKKGDSVLLCLELESYADEATPDEYMREYAFSCEKSYIFTLTPRVMFSLLYLNAPGDYAEAIHRWNEKLSGATERDISALNADYSVVRLGPNGDFRGQEPEKPITYRPPVTVLSPYARESLSGLNQWCRRQGIRLIVTWPNRIDAPPPDGSNQFALHEKVAQFCKEQGVEVVGTPEESVYPRELFIDTVYHLNEIGKRIRTDKLIRHLREIYRLRLPTGQKTIYLMASRYSVQNERGIFDKNENVSYKYLTESPSQHPDWITPGDLPSLAQSGARIVCLDDATETLAGRAGVRFHEIRRSEVSLGDWIRKYDHHFFFFSFVGVTQVPVPLANLPEDFTRVFSGDGYRAGVVGTGPWKKIHRIARGADQAEWWRRRFDPFPVRTPFHFRVIAKSGPIENFSKTNPPILVEGETLASSKPGLAVAVIDPYLGSLTEEGTFNGEPLIEWKLRQMAIP